MRAAGEFGVPKDINISEARQRRPKRVIFYILALTLLMLGIFTDNHDFSLTLDDFALVANLFDRRPDFHNIIIPFTRSSVGEITI